MGMIPYLANSKRTFEKLSVQFILLQCFENYIYVLLMTMNDPAGDRIIS